MQSRILTALHILPAFELAARYLSFKRAAQELHLTPSAVSQQIRSLEDTLGLKLFHRMTRSLKLTDAGERFVKVASDTLDVYRSGTERVIRMRARPALRLSTDPHIAHELLIPELHTFQEQHADLELRIETSSGLVDFERDAVDAAVRFGIGPWPGLTSKTLCSATAAAVCAPGFIKHDRVRSLRGLARVPLICLRDRPDPWMQIGAALGVELRGERLVFDSYWASIRAAEKSLGVAVGLFPLTTVAVLDGRLVTPLSIRVRTRARYHFVCRKEDAERGEFVALRTWLSERFAALPEPPGSWEMLDEDA